MDMIEYKLLRTEDIISFIKDAHEDINKTLDLNEKDADLLNLENYYGASTAGFWCILEIIILLEP